MKDIKQLDGSGELIDTGKQKLPIYWKNWDQIEQKKMVCIYGPLGVQPTAPDDH
jgi:hypothetical protein